MDTIEVVIVLLGGVFIGLALSAIHDHLCLRQFKAFKRRMYQQQAAGTWEARPGPEPAATSGGVPGP